MTQLRLRVGDGLTAEMRGGRDSCFFAKVALVYYLNKESRKLAAQAYQLVIGGIALPNVASIALHEKMGFQKVAQFNEVGFKFDRWLDVGYWEKRLAAQA